MSPPPDAEALRRRPVPDHLHDGYPELRRLPDSSSRTLLHTYRPGEAPSYVPLPLAVDVVRHTRPRCRALLPPLLLLLCRCARASSSWPPRCRSRPPRCSPPIPARALTYAPCPRCLLLAALGCTARSPPPAAAPHRNGRARSRTIADAAVHCPAAVPHRPRACRRPHCLPLRAAPSSPCRPRPARPRGAALARPGPCRCSLPCWTCCFAAAAPHALVEAPASATPFCRARRERLPPLAAPLAAGALPPRGCPMRMPCSPPVSCRSLPPVTAALPRLAEATASPRPGQASASLGAHAHRPVNPPR
nr:DBF4-type zinc finger-containing protein 2 homolog [Aegilops tauschii subsp. strangulata]